MLSKNLLTSNPFMEQIGTSVQSKADTATANQNTVSTKLSKRNMAATENYDEVIEEPPSQSKSGCEEAYHGSFSRWRSK